MAQEIKNGIIIDGKNMCRVQTFIVVIARYIQEYVASFARYSKIVTVLLN